MSNRFGEGEDNRSPIEKTFDLPHDDELEELESLLLIDIPDNPELKDIARIALETYKKQIELMAQIEPKYRQRYLEVANGYLNTAKEALSKIEDVRQKQEKQDFDRAVKEGAIKKNDDNDGLDRDSLYERVARREKSK